MVEDAARRRSRFEAFAGPLAVLSGFFGGVYVLSGAALGSEALLLCGGLAFGLAAASAHSRSYVREGRIVEGASLVAYGLMTIAFTFSLLLPFTWPTLVMMPIAAVALVLPYLEGPPLRRIIVIGTGVSLLAAALGSTRADDDRIPPALRAFVLLGTVAVAVVLIMLLLWQYSTRLSEAFEFLLRANRAVAESEDRFRTLVTSTTQMVWTTDAAGRAITDASGWRRFTGLTTEQWMDSGWRAATHPDDQARAAQAWMDAVKEARPYQERVRLRRADGVWIPCLVTATPVLAADGTIREWVGTHTDISAEVRAEQVLLDESRRKDEFLAMLSHELRNPLAPVITALGLLKARGPLGQELQVVDRQAHHLKALIEDLLDVARINSGKIALQVAPMDLATAVAQGTELATPLLESQGHQLTTDLAPDLYVRGDVVRLAQIVENLLTNAAKYTPAGGHVQLTGRRTGNEIALEVRDDGVGIDPALLPRIFDLFQQGETSIDRARGGLGIGLSLVRRLTELHGGTVEARSDGPGTGSAFVIRLPASDELPARPAPSPVPAAGTALRVLVVDDNRDAAELLGEYLRMCGHDVRIEHDGTAGLAGAREMVPDVVFLDIGLPGMDGLAVARSLRADPRTAALRLVALTGYGQASDRAQTREAGFDQHLVKPVEIGDVERILAGVAPRA